MKGIGVDIIEIERIKKAIQKRKRFKTRFFSDKELNYCEQYKKPWANFAGRFAAKEAVVKALGTGFSGFKWQDIEIISTSSGKPEVKLHNQAKKIAEGQGIIEIMISISHCHDYAVAQAVAM